MSEGFAVRFIRDWDITADQQPSRYDARVILMSQYTAQQVRDIANRAADSLRWVEREITDQGSIEGHFAQPALDILAAYAERLEQDEQGWRTIAGYSPSVISRDGSPNHCYFCGMTEQHGEICHSDYCLWLRATEAVKPPTAP